MKYCFLIVAILISSNVKAQVDCLPNNNEKSIVASHYSPYLGAIWLTHLSTLVLGASMPVNKEEVELNKSSYGVLAGYGILSWLTVQGISCGATGKPPSEDFFREENIDVGYYKQQRKFFWWIYGLDLAAISYMASISHKEDRWNRVVGVAAIPWFYDLVINNLFFKHKYHLYENPIFLEIKNNSETKEENVSLVFRTTF